MKGFVHMPYGVWLSYNAWAFHVFIMGVPSFFHIVNFVDCYPLRFSFAPKVHSADSFFSRVFLFSYVCIYVPHSLDHAARRKKWSLNRFFEWLKQIIVSKVLQDRCNRHAYSLHDCLFFWFGGGLVSTGFRVHIMSEFFYAHHAWRPGMNICRVVRLSLLTVVVYSMSVSCQTLLNLALFFTEPRDGGNGPRYCF